MIADNREIGFTLIELMIVIAIIGILAAVAIPQFNAYRKRSFNSAALSDLRNAIGAQEAYHTENQEYAANVSQLTGSYGLTTSTNVQLTTEGSASSYTIVSYHDTGSKTYSITGPGGSIESL